jgi:hypothetical protein
MSHRYKAGAKKSSLDDNRPLAEILESLIKRIEDLKVYRPEEVSTRLESLNYYTSEFRKILENFRETRESDMETRRNKN